MARLAEQHDSAGQPFLGIGKVHARGRHSLKVAARHNKREDGRQHPGIDPARSHLNLCLAGPATAEGILAEHARLKKEGGVAKERANGVSAIEVVFSLPAGSTIDPRRYFTDCTTWAANHFGLPILSSDVHLDQAVPHCHLLLFPPIVKRRLNGSAAIGYGAQFRGHLTAFGKQVASRHGLRIADQRMHPAQRTAALDMVLDDLRQRDDPVLTSSLWPVVRAAIARDPMPFLQSLGIEPPRPQRLERPWQNTFIATGKGSSTWADSIGATR